MTITKADFIDLPEAENMQSRGRVARQNARMRLNLEEGDLATTLGTDLPMVRCLEAGVFDSVTSPLDGSVHALPESSLNASTLRTLVLYRKFLTACEVLPSVAHVPGDVPGAVLQSGDSDLSAVAWLRTSVQGYQGRFSGSTMPNPVVRLQLLTTYALSVETVADAIGASPAQTKTWLLSPVAELPFNTADAFEVLTHVLHYLSTGPTNGVTSKTKVASF